MTLPTNNRRVPGPKQYELLRALGPDCVCLTGDSRWDPLVKHGWVKRLDHTAIQITPDGVRALAAAMEKHGYPQWPEDFKPKKEKAA